jgi:hypothetical protein
MSNDHHPSRSQSENLQQALMRIIRIIQEAQTDPAEKSISTSEQVFGLAKAIARMEATGQPLEIPQQRNRSTKQKDTLTSDEAVVYLGLDRLKRPKNALNRLMNSGHLTRRKLGGRLIFHRDELDQLVLHGDALLDRPKRGRPKGSRNKKGPSAS